MKRVVLAALCITFLVGCAVQKVISPFEQQRALGLIDQGVLELRRGELQNARASFEVAYELTHSAAAVDGLGCVAMLQGGVDEAERLFRRALSIDPEYSAALGNLALLFEASQRYGLAEETYRRAVSLRPDDGKLRNNYALFLQRHGSSSDIRAEDELKRAQALYPHPIIIENYQQVKARNG